MKNIGMMKVKMHVVRPPAICMIAALLALILAQGALAGDWPMFRHDAAHTGTSNEIVEPPLELLWKYTTGSYVTSSPAISGGLVYVGSDDNNLYALDAATGALKWKYATGGRVTSSPAISGGLVYVGSDDNNLYALDATTGALKWKYTTGGTVASSPAISSGMVYIGSVDTNLYALDAATGALKWKYTTGGQVIISPAISGGVIYVGSWDGNIYALDAATGVLKWKYTTGSQVASSPAISGNIVYIGSYDYNVYAIDASTGTFKWKYTTGGQISSSPTISSGVIYVGSWDGNIYALDAATGAIKWKYLQGNVDVRSDPTVSGGVIYVNSGGIHAFDAATGALKWNYSIGAYGETSSPAVSGNIVYFGSYDNNVYAFATAPKPMPTPVQTINPQSPVHNIHIGPGTAGLQCDTCHGFPPVVPPPQQVCANCHPSGVPTLTPVPITGSIAISSTPSGASIYLDELYKGTTPKILTNIPQGSHEIKLTLTNYNDWSYTTLVSAGGSTKLSTQLTSITPTFTLLPTPTSTKTPELQTPELPYLLNRTLIGSGAIIVGLISLYLIIGALRKHKSKANVIEELEKQNPVAAPAEEPDRKSQAVLIEKSKTNNVEKPKEAGAISVKSVYEYRGAKIYYKIKIENNAIEPVGDIKFHLFVPEVFLLAEKEKAISMLETHESKTVTFEIRPTGECGDCNVSGKIEYYDYATKGRKMLDIENKSLSVICPVLKRKEIDLQQWEKVTDELIKAEENIKELSAPAENLFNITSRVIKDNGMFMLKPEITSTPQLFNGLAMFYAEGVTGLRYATYMEVVGGVHKSRMILKVWAEKEEALTGFYHRILDDIEKRIDVKIFIDDTIVQQHIHIGDKIGTQVKDSFVQRSTIGAGARKYPNCGREVDANEKFCMDCGARL